MLVNYGPRLSTFFVYALLGVLCYSAETVVRGWLATFLWLAKFPLFACAFFALGDWVFQSSLRGMERAANARAITRASRLATEIARLDATRLEVMRASLGIEADAIEDGKHTTTIGGVEIPDSWMTKYLQSADGFKLKPVREFAEGSRDRLYAQTVSNFLVSRGAAVEASGNQPVRVKNWNDAMGALGWER
jgi:hypothetical protein